MRHRLAVSFLVILVMTTLPLSAGSTPSARLLGVTVERAQGLTKVTIAATAPFGYTVAVYPDRILLTLEGIITSPALLPIARGTVGKVEAATLANGKPRLTLTLREPQEIYEEKADGPVLNLTLGPPRPRIAQTIPVPQKQTEKAPEPPKTSHPAVQKPSAAPVPGSKIVPAGSSPGIGLQKPKESTTPPSVQRLTLEIREGSGTLLPVRGLSRVAVSNPAIIGVVPISDRELLVNGKQSGATTLFLWQEAQGLTIYDVTVQRGSNPLAKVHEVLKTIAPEGSVEVLVLGEAQAGNPQSTGGQGGAVILLVGKVPSQHHRDRVEEAARAFGAKVINLIEVARQVQVKLEVQVVELDRTVSKDLGITWGGGPAQGDGSAQLPGQLTFQVLTQPVLQMSGRESLLAKLQVLVQEGRARLLAQPSLVVMAGKEASLLLGGEVPIPIQTQGTVSIMFKEFGVKLRAKPEIQAGGRIFLDLTPEVSSLDFAQGVKLEGFVVPALKTRRVATIVTLSSGQTLAIGGLFQHEESEVVQKFPFLGDLPVIGALFRSTSFQRRESELVLLVTPEIMEVPS